MLRQNVNQLPNLLSQTMINLLLSYYAIGLICSIYFWIEKKGYDVYSEIKLTKENFLCPITTFVMVSIVNFIGVFLIVPVFFPVLIYEKLTK